MKHVVIAGASGLVGRHLVAEVAKRDDCQIILLCRRSGTFTNTPRVSEVEFDFDSADSYQRIGNDIPCNFFFCCLGTTIKKAGSPDAFAKVDLHYPSLFIERMRALHSWPKLVVVSSVGADTPRGLYLNTKFMLEERLRKSGLPYLIVRPSLLLGKRNERRPLEYLAQCASIPIVNLAKILRLAHFQPLARLLPISAAQLARAIVTLGLDSNERATVAEGRLLHEPTLLH